MSVVLVHLIIGCFSAYVLMYRHSVVSSPISRGITLYIIRAINIIRVIIVIIIIIIILFFILLLLLLVVVVVVVVAVVISPPHPHLFFSVNEYNE